MTTAPCAPAAQARSRPSAGARSIFSIAALAAMVIAPLQARAMATAWVGDPHAEARLVTATEAAGSASTVDAGIEIRMAPGWHTYWRTPGDAGLAPRIDWSGSVNLGRAEIAWPAPTRLSVQGLQTYVYPDHVVLPVAVRLATPGRPLVLHTSVDYAACAEVCVPYHADLSLTLPAGLAVPGANAPLITAARAAVPGTLGEAGLALTAVSATPAGDSNAVVTVRLHATAAPLRRPDLFIEGLPQETAGPPQVTLADGARNAVISVPVSGSAAVALAASPLIFTVTDGPARAAEFAATPTLGTASPMTSSIFGMLAVALLGGLILNLMPCVLPVLSLKLLSAAQLAGAHRSVTRLSLLATAAGVLASFAVLAAGLIVLRAAGAAIGWGIQFQQPWFLAGMAVITALFAANLWDWFAIDLPRGIYERATQESRRPLANAFLTGGFATLLATPCSAPFVGTAVGFALSHGPGEIVSIFAALGMGLAAPYLLIALFPGLIGLLPKPGRWMVKLRLILGIILLGTSAWLIWVLASETGFRAAAAAGSILLAMLAMLAWRARQAPGAPFRRVGAATAAVLAIATIVGSQLATRPAAPTTEPGGETWRPFDLDEVRRQVTAGKVVLVDVTAAWCLTCKANKAVVLDREPVVSRLRTDKVVAMRADWTRPDPAITAYLQSFGRYGVPLDVVYGPRRPSGEALPELLTTPMVMEALDRAAGEAATLAKR